LLIVPIFDYIIAGAGPTGITIAYRLALANAARKVLLIEAGDKPDIDVMVIILST
jgi:choline dehydrogenase-like flavoprotein